jgi:hypothetical protein
LQKILQAWAVAAVATGLVACDAAPILVVEPTTEVQAPKKPDAGRVITTQEDAGTPIQWVAGEPCPPESFGRLVFEDGGVEDTPDGSFVFGLCAAVRTVSGQVVLNERPATGFRLEFKGGNVKSEYEKLLPANGEYAVKVLRSNYDIFYFQPSGVFSTHQGQIDMGRIDLREDQSRRLEARSHTLAGSALFGGLPFTPTRAPFDTALETYGASRLNFAAAQSVSTQSQSGSYELKLLEGQFAVFLNAPPAALYGTELRRFMVHPVQIQFDRDQTLDIDIPTATLEGELTIDGRPIADRRAGTDFRLEYTVPGEREATVITHHEGGYRTITGMVPKAEYGITLSMVGAPDRHFPSEVFALPVSFAVDLRTDKRLSANLSTIPIEGSIAIDGVPVTPRPNYNWHLFMYGGGGPTTNDRFLEYLVPLESASFNLQAFGGNYFTVIQLSDNFADDLVDGWFIVDRFKQVNRPTQLPIDIKTGMYSGRLKIDGAPPPAGLPVGTFFFVNRDPLYRGGFFLRRAVTSEDGQVRARLPIGNYDVYFTIDRDVYPEYAAGWRLLATQLLISQNEQINDDFDYKTVLVTGPIRVGGQVVQKLVGGEEVGVELTHFNGRIYRWGFSGGQPNYRMRVPPGDYDVDFVINRGGVENTAWGSAPLGPKLRAGTPDAPPLPRQ